MDNNILTCDVLVIGGGMAACFAAIKAAEAGASVIMADKGYVGRSGQSPYADGFMICNPEWGHDLGVIMERLNRHSEYLNNRWWTEKCLLDSYPRWKDLVGWGCEFRTDPEHDPAARGPVGDGPAGTQFSKKNGPYGAVLRKQCLKSGVKIMDRLMIVELLKQDGRVCGGIGLPNESTELVTIIAKCTISCAGACGYKPLGYPALMQLTGDGEAMAFRAGADILGKEFVDAHFSPLGMPDPVSQRTAGDPPGPPAGMKKPEGTGKGGGPGVRFNSVGEIISAKPDSVSDYMFTYLQSEFAVHAGQGPIMNRGSVSYGGAALGMSLRKADGIWPADHECRSTVPGLFAAGDALGTMQNGAAYSQGGGSLCNCAVTGAIAAETAAAEAHEMPMPNVADEELNRAKDYVMAPIRRSGGFGPNWTTSLLQNYMMPYFVYFIKKADRLQATLTLIEFLREHISPMLYAKDAHELRLCHETANMILSAEFRLQSALFRTESRGNHYREDYPARDDENWLCWTKLKNVNGQMTAEKVPVPEEWRPDSALTYREKYPFVLPGEEEVR